MQEGHWARPGTISLPFFRSSTLLSRCPTNSGRPKENFFLSAESRKRAFEKSPFLQKYRKYRKRPFLPKELLSAERASFCRNWRQILPKLMGISAKSEAYFCRKSPFRQKDALSAERVLSAERPKVRIYFLPIQKDFLLKVSAEIEPKCPFG